MLMVERFSMATRISDNPRDKYDVLTDFPLVQLARKHNHAFLLPEYDAHTIAEVEHLLANNGYTDRSVVQEHRRCLASLQKRMILAAEEGDGTTDLEFVVVRRKIANLLDELAHAEHALPRQMVFKASSRIGAPSS